MITRIRARVPFQPIHPACLALVIVLVIPEILHGEVRVSGRVLYSDSPVPNVRLVLLPRLPEFEKAHLRLVGNHGPDPADTTQTDEDGSFELTAPRPGMWVVRLEDERFLPVEYSLTPLVSDTRLPPAAVEKARWIDVQVLSDDRTPVRDAVVRGRTLVSGGEEDWVRTDALSATNEQGSARIPAGTDEVSEIEAFSAGLKVRRAKVVAPTSVSLTLREGETAAVTVRGSSGKVLKDAILQHQDGWPIGTTGKEGQLRILLPPTGSIYIEALTQTGGGGVSKTTEAGQVTIEVHMPRTVKGRVVDRYSRRPVEGALVWVKDEPRVFVRSGRNGEYELVSQPGGEILASGSGYLTASQPSPPGTPSGGEAVSGPTFALEPAGSTIKGIVVDPEGDAVPDAEVGAEAGFGVETARVSFTTVDGAFRLSRLAARQQILLRAVHPDYTEDSLLVRDLRAGGTRDGLKLTLGRLRAVYGQVLSESLNPLSQVKVFAYRGSNRPLTQAVSDREGRFDLGKLPAGRYRIEAIAQGFARESRIAEVTTGKGPFDIGRVLLEPEAKLRGWIVDVNGQPVRGVEVFLGRASGARVIDATGRPAGDPAAVSDKEGGFEITGLYDGEAVRLETWHEDYLPANLRGIEVQSGREIEVVLERGLSLHGYIEDEDGKPIEGAWVSLAEEGSRAPMGFGGRTRYTDKQGSFVFKRVAASSATLTVAAEGFVVEEIHGLQVASEEFAEEVRVVLERGGVIEGRVLEPSGKPAIGASVGLVQEESGFSLASQWGSDRTDGDGRFRLKNIRPGQQSVSASHPEFAKVVEETNVGSGAQWLELQFRRRHGFAVSGNVLDEGGAGVEQLGLMLVPIGGGRSNATTTGPGGWFEFARVAAGRYELRPRDSERVIRPEDQYVSVIGEPVNGLEVRLVEGVSISGRLTGLDDNELRRARVSATSGSSSRLGRIATERGTYSIKGLTDGVWEILGEIPDEGLAASEVVTVTRSANELQKDLDFRQGLRISGYVISAGEPVRWFPVQLEGIDTSEHFSVSTDENGRFEIEGVRLGSYWLEVLSEVRSDLASPSVLHRDRLELSSDEELVVELAPGTISGQVTESWLSDGIQNARVTLSETSGKSGREVVRTSTGTLGNFTLDPVPPGQWVLAAEKEGYDRVERRVEVRGNQVLSDQSLELRPTDGQELEVILPSGEPPPAVHVEVLDAQGREVASERLVPGSDGRVRAKTVSPGRWSFFVRSEPGGFVGAAADVLVPGPPLVLRLHLSGSLRVEVPSLRSEAFGPAPIALSSEVPSLPPIKLGPLRYGEVIARWLPAGEWEVAVERVDGTMHIGIAEVTSGNEAHVILE